MHCSYEDCGVEFPDNKVGYAMSIFDQVNGAVLWGTYCNADCLLSDVGPFLVQRADNEKPQVNSSENVIGNLKFTSMVSQEIVSEIREGTNLDLVDSFSEPTYLDLEEEVGAIVYSGTLYYSPDIFLRIIHDSSGIMISFTGFGNVAPIYLPIHELVPESVDAVISSVKQLLPTKLYNDTALVSTSGEEVELNVVNLKEIF